MTSTYSVSIADDCYYENFIWIGPCHRQSWYPDFDAFNSVEALLELGHSAELIVLSLQAEEQDKCLRVLIFRQRVPAAWWSGSCGRTPCGSPDRETR